MTTKTKAVYQGIVTRTARLNNLDQADASLSPLPSAGEAGVRGGSFEGQKIYSIKGLSSGKELTDAQLIKINSYAVVPLTKDQVHYAQLLMAHNGIDRDRERFNEEGLEDFARTLPGKGFFVEGHPGGWTGHGGPGEGLFFDARVVQMSPAEFKAKTLEDIELPDGVLMVSCLMADAYVLVLDSNSDTRAKMNAGIIRFSSIGFKAPYYSITDDHGNHIYGEYRSKGEALEGSLVWLGAQPGAGVMKSAGSPKTATGSVEEQPNHDKAKGDLPAMEKQLLILGTRLGKTFTVDTLADSILALVGEKDASIKTLTDQVATLTPDAADGKAFRKGLIEDLIKASVLLGEMKSDEASQKAEETYYMTVPIERLKTLSGKAMTQARKQFPDKYELPAGDQQDREKHNTEAQQAAAPGAGAAAGKPSLSDEAKKRAEASGKK